MHRPIGVTVLAILAGLAGIVELWRAAVFMGWVSWTFVGKEVSFPDPQWGQVFWALILAAIWFWVAAGFWNLRAYAWSFGTFISLFTLIFGFFAAIGSSSLEAEFVPMFIALLIFFYLNYPGVQQQFIDHEMSLLNPEQRAAIEQQQAAAAAFAAASAPKPPTAPPPAAPPPAAPPSA
jgi:hypothetical protein